MYKKFTLIIVTVIILFGPMGQFLLFKFTPMYDLNLLTALYNDASWVKEKPKIAIMGSSHARYHIIPSEIAKLNTGYEFKDIVNIGENAASPFEMYISFMKNRDKFTDLETVYYTLEPHMLGEKYYPYNKYESIFLDYKQWKYLEENHKKKNNYFFPFQTFVESLQFSTSDRSKSNGYSALKHQKFNEFSDGKVSKLIYEPLKLFPVSSHGVKYFKMLKEELGKQGTDLIFVLTPTYTWQKYYAKEAKAYDDMLISKLNEALGESIVIGSFWPEDFDLKYNDFKDDTHMADSGAKKFTQAIFSDISIHKKLKTHPIKNTFLYRNKSNKLLCDKVKVVKLNMNVLNWKPANNAQIVLKDKLLEFSAKGIDKFTYLGTKFSDVKDVEMVTLEGGLPLEELKMFSISLRNKKEYAHFFIKENKFNSGTIVLTKKNISKASKDFEFNTFDGITIRLYPRDGGEVHNYKIKSIQFNICARKEKLDEN